MNFCLSELFFFGVFWFSDPNLYFTIVIIISDRTACQMRESYLLLDLQRPEYLHNTYFLLREPVLSNYAFSELKDFFNSHFDWPVFT